MKRVCFLLAIEQLVARRHPEVEVETVEPYVPIVPHRP
jgi:hypothetical protein